MFKRKDEKLILIAFFIFLLSTFYITYPLIFHLSDFLNGEFVIAWIMNWNIHSLLTGNILHIFEANIYYPYHHSLAFSDFLLTSSVFSIPFFLIFHNPMVPSNFTFLTGLILTGFCTFLLSFYLTKNFLASLLSGLLVIFSPVTLDKRPHLQILSLWLIPSSILFFLHFFKTSRLKYLIFSLVFFLLQTYNNLMGFYFIVFSYFFIGVFNFQKAKNFIKNKKVLGLFIITFLLVLPTAIPYFQVSKEFSYVRDIRDSIHFAIQPEDLLVPSEYSRFSLLPNIFSDSARYFRGAEIKPAFLGLALLILTILVVIFAFQKRRKDALSLFLIIGIVGLVLAFGPALHLFRKTIHYPFLIPLPYGLFYYILPGFQGFRNSARFEMLFVLMAPVSIAIMLDEVLSKKKKIVKNLIYFIFFALVILEFKFPINYLKTDTFASFPPVYFWINQNTPKDSVIMETPIYNWDNNPYGDNREVLREYYSTIHFRKIVGGGSGFSPPVWQDFAIFEFKNFPSDKSIEVIKNIKVSYLVIHKVEFDFLNKTKWKYKGVTLPSGNEVLAALQKRKDLKLIKKLGNDYVFKFN